MSEFSEFSELSEIKFKMPNHQLRRNKTSCAFQMHSDDALRSPLACERVYVDTLKRTRTPTPTSNYNCDSDSGSDDLSSSNKEAIFQTEGSFSSKRLEDTQKYREIQPYQLWAYAKKIELIIHEEDLKNTDNDDSLDASSTASLVSEQYQCSPSRSHRSKASKGSIFESISNDSDDDGDFGLYELDDYTNSNIDIHSSPKPKSPEKSLLKLRLMKEQQSQPIRILCIYEHLKSYTSCRSFVVNSDSTQFQSCTNLNASIILQNSSYCSSNSRRTEVNIAISGFRIFQHVNSGIGDVQYKIKCSMNGVQYPIKIWKSFSDFKRLATALQCYVELKLRSEISEHDNELKNDPNNGVARSAAPQSQSRKQLEESFHDNYIFRDCLHVWNELMRIRPSITRNIRVPYLMIELSMIEAFMEKVFFDIPSLEMLEEFMDA